MSKTGRKNKKVMIWVYDLDQDLLKYLRAENIVVVALLQGISDEVPSFSIFDLFYRTEKVPFCEHTPSPMQLSDAFVYRYLDCISRVSFVPKTEEYTTWNIGIVGADNVADWAQFHAQTVLHILQHYAPDEIWIFNPPHLGIDNLFVEVGRKLGLPVLIFDQSLMPGKFFYSINREPSTSHRLEFVAPQSGAFKPNLFYMRQCDKVPALRRFAERVSFYTSAPFSARCTQAIERLYLAALRRDWAPLLLLMDCLCTRTRVVAFTRLIRRLQFRSDLKKRTICQQHDLLNPFVYFGLHFQPEASTSAKGGFFANQLNAIEAMREILPAGWWICVKENPIQRYMYRDPAFYARVRQWPDVKFIDDSADSEVLIKQSRIVATITGTMGYEALLLGKPCVYFGDAWYEGLPNSYRFNAGLDLKEISNQRVDAQELSNSVEIKMAKAADGVVFPLYQGLLDNDADWSSLMRTTAQSLRRISDEANSIIGKV